MKTSLQSDLTTIEENNRQRQSIFDGLAENWKEDFDDNEKQFLSNALMDIKSHVPHGSLVLDIGCGNGILFKYLQEYEVTGIDLSPGMLHKAKLRGDLNVRSLIQADAHQMPFHDQTFLLATMLAVYPHFDAPEIVLDEVRRVLSESGYLAIIHTKSAEQINSHHTSMGGILAKDLLPDLNSIAKTLDESGFLILEQRMNGGIFILAEKKRP
jgi:ubiquinone/menaquinone biosynthesis C-methylase UbiE